MLDFCVEKTVGSEISNDDRALTFISLKQRNCISRLRDFSVTILRFFFLFI